MNIPISVGDYTGYSKAINANEVINMMVEPDTEGGPMPYVMIGTPGCKFYIDTAKTGEGRGGFGIPGVLLAIVGRFLFKINTVTYAITIVDQLETTTGSVMFAENPTQIMMIDSTYGYIYDKAGSTLTKITDEDFPTPKACAWKDGYGVVVEAGTGKFFVSGLNDFATWDALQFTTAEFEPDNLVSCACTPNNLIAFGEKTTQFYYNSGNSTFPFDPQQGANMQVGCGATHSPAANKNAVFWIDDSGQIRKVEGYNQIIISTRQIERRISEMTTFSDAVGYVYTQYGHTFYNLTFPTEKLTLVYDLSTGQWHRRTSGVDNGRYRPIWMVQDGNRVFSGDYGNGKIYLLDQDTYTDNGLPIKSTVTLQNVNTERRMIRHDLLELHIEAGVGSDLCPDPQLWMQYSDDDGKTWSHEKWRSMGKIGENKRRQKFYALGISRTRIYRICVVDPVKKVFLSARIEGEPLGY